MMIDPKKWNAAGVQEAADYASPLTIGEQLLCIASKDDISLSEIQLSNIALLPTAAYENALPEKGAGEYRARLLRLASKSYLEVLEDVIRYLDENIQKAKSADASFLAGLPKPAAHPSQQLLTTKMKTAVESLPDYLRVPLMHENITIACVSNTNLETSHAGASRAAIFFDTNFLLGVSPEALNPVMKEEVIHHFAKKSGYDTREDYLEAADALFDKGKKEGVDSLLIVKMLKKIHYDKDKQCNLAACIQNSPLGNKRQFSAELFVEYFHVRDRLLEEAIKLKGSSAALQTDEDAVARTNNLMRSMVGDAIHTICQEFETAMRQEADQLRGQHRRLGA
jgi:hypothetical protein